MLSGPSIDLYKEMLAKFPDLYLMASGGVSKMDDIVALDEAGVPGVIFGKVIIRRIYHLTRFENLSVMSVSE